VSGKSKKGAEAFLMGGFGFPQSVSTREQQELVFPEALAIQLMRHCFLL